MHRHNNKTLDIKMEMTFDNKDRHLYYFAGDTIQGKVFLTSNQSHFNVTRHFRFAWTGTIQVQPVESNKDTRTYFRELYKLSPRFYKTMAKTEKGTLPLYVCEFVHLNDADMLYMEEEQENDIIMKKNKTIAVTFSVKVPNDRVLPSSTETNNSSNKIIYLLEAFIIDESNENKRPTFFCQRLAPIYEKIYTQPLMKEQKNEKVFTIYSSDTNLVIATAALRATLPCLGSQAGITIPVSISIWNSHEFTRKQGIAVSLIRIHHVYANDRVFMSQPEKMHRVVTDLHLIKRSKEHNDSMSIQMIHVGLPIPKNILPTITFESSHLLSVSYFVRVQVHAQQGVYDEARSEFMMVDLPFTIGTIPTNQHDGRVTSPPFLQQQQQQHQQQELQTSEGKSSTNVSLSSSAHSLTSDDNNKRTNKTKIISTKKISRHIFKGGVFRKSSSASSGTANSMETLELELEDNNSSISSHNSKKSNNNTPFKLFEEVQIEEKKVTASKSTSILNQIEQLAINEHQDNHSSNELMMKTVIEDDIVNNRNDIINNSSSNGSNNCSVNNSISNSNDDNNNSGVVFNMFFDEDTDDEIEYSLKNKNSHSDDNDGNDLRLTAHTKMGLGSQQKERESMGNNAISSDPLSSNMNIFQMFPDSEDDEL